MKPFLFVLATSMFSLTRIAVAQDEKAASKAEKTSEAIDKPDKVNVLYTGVRLHSDVSWHPDGNQVLFSGLDPAIGISQMFIVKRNDPEKIVPVPGQPRNWRVIDCDWSPDGHQIVFTAEPPP